MFAVYRDITLLLVYCAAIFYASHQPTLIIDLPYQQQDKFVHLLAYAILATLAWRCFEHGLKSINKRILFVLLFAALYAASDEYHQSFIEGRTASVFDWYADILGASLAVLYWAWKSKLWTKSAC
ncbi:MAG: VanZ family protein [Ghiorsea sp.]|nr:VanZ family protein [Ghiorsea sp.]